MSDVAVIMTFRNLVATLNEHYFRKIDFSLLQIKNRQFDSSDPNLHVKNRPEAKKMSLFSRAEEIFDGLG